MPGYTDFADRLRLYVVSIAEHCTVPFEILIVEDRCGRNVALLDTIKSNSVAGAAYGPFS